MHACGFYSILRAMRSWCTWIRAVSNAISLHIGHQASNSQEKPRWRIEESLFWIATKVKSWWMPLFKKYYLFLVHQVEENNFKWYMIARWVKEEKEEYSWISSQTRTNQMPSKMYSPTSSVLDTLDRQVRSQMIQPYQNQHPISQTFGSSQCLKFRYFSIFLFCTTCLALLSASLATHKWIISKPIRMLKLNSSHTNWTSLMLIASQNDSPNSASLSLSHREQESMRHNSNSLVPTFGIDSSNSQANDLSGSPTVTLSNSEAQTSGQSKKFQGEIYFGLFKGLKVLNHGFGDRQSLISGKLSD